MEVLGVERVDLEIDRSNSRDRSEKVSLLQGVRKSYEGMSEEKGSS